MFENYGTPAWTFAQTLNLVFVFCFGGAAIFTVIVLGLEHVLIPIWESVLRFIGLKDN